MRSTSEFNVRQTEPYNWLCQSLHETNSVGPFSRLFWIYKAGVRGKPDHGNSGGNYFEGNRSSFTLQRIGTLASRDRSAIPPHRCRVAGRKCRPRRSPQAGCVRYLLMIRQSIILPSHLFEIRKDL